LASIAEIIGKIKSQIIRIKTRLHAKLFLPDSEWLAEQQRPPGSSTTVERLATGGTPTPTPAFAPQPVTVLKKLRRQLPIHKNKFDWNLNKVILLQNL
jgi:hypothetical protein